MNGGLSPPRMCQISCIAAKLILRLISIPASIFPRSKLVTIVENVSELKRQFVIQIVHVGPIKFGGFRLYVERFPSFGPKMLLRRRKDRQSPTSCFDVQILRSSSA